MIGDFINISPSVVTGGSVVINDNSDIGIGSTIKNNILIDKNVKIGGKSFVNKDCKSNSLYYGSPIKKIK
jgi:acetyltransferase-like isoleucine patch superfamily enzyme